MPHRFGVFLRQTEGIRVYKNKPCAVRINTRIHADLSSFDDKSSERFEPRQTAVCRLTPHVPNRKLKPPQMRRFEFPGRVQILRPVAHTKSAKPDNLLYRVLYLSQRVAIFRVSFIILLYAIRYK